MPLLDTGVVLVENCTVAWDAITRPDVRDDGSKSHKLKVILPLNSPDAELVNQIASTCLQESKFKGVMPNGGLWAITPVGPGEFNDEFAGCYLINPGTNRLPDVFNDSGQKLDPMQYGSLFYPGQKVSVIVNCWAYDNKSKGIATGLEGVRIELAANAPQKAFGGGGGYNASSVFGGGAAQPQQAMGQPQQAMGQPQQAMGQPQQAMGQPQQAMGQPQQAMGQPQQAMGQPQQAMGQPQQAMGQPQQAMGQPQQAMGQPQQAMGQPQQAMGQPMQQNAAFLPGQA